MIQTRQSDHRKKERRRKRSASGRKDAFGEHQSYFPHGSVSIQSKSCLSNRKDTDMSTFRGHFLQVTGHEAMAQYLIEVKSMYEKI